MALTNYRRFENGQRFHRHVRGVGGNAYADCNGCDASEKQVSRDMTPPSAKLKKGRRAIKDNRTLFAVWRQTQLSRPFYFVNIGLEGVGGVGAAGASWNVSQRFQPAGRFALSNSP